MSALSVSVAGLVFVLSVIGLCNAIRDAGRYIARALLECERARSGSIGATIGESK